MRRATAAWRPLCTPTPRRCVRPARAGAGRRLWPSGRTCRRRGASPQVRAARGAQRVNGARRRAAQAGSWFWPAAGQALTANQVAHRPACRSSPPCVSCLAAGHAYAAVISACAAGGQWQKAVSLFDEMLAWGVRPDVVSCTALITGGLGRPGCLVQAAWVGVLHLRGVCAPPLRPLFCALCLA